MEWTDKRSGRNILTKSRPWIVKETVLSCRPIVAPYGFGHSAYSVYSVVYSVFLAEIGHF